MADSGTPFDDIRRLISTIPGPDEAAAKAVRERDRELTKPAGSLGRLEWLVEWEWHRTEMWFPRTKRPVSISRGDID